MTLHQPGDLKLSTHLALTVMGTVIGAGFASGQEILRFFVVFGWKGGLGIGLSGLALMLLSSLIVSSAARYRVRSHRQLLALAVPTPVGRAVDVLLTLLLLVSTSIMFAGGGAVFAQQLGMQEWPGTLAMAFVSWVAASREIRGVMLLNLLLVPLLVGALAYLACSVPFRLGGSFVLWAGTPARYAPAWWAAALLYPSYNMFLAMSGLSSIGGLLPLASARRGAMWGSILLTILMAATAIILWAGGQRTAALPVPVLDVAGRVHVWLGSSYSLVIAAAMLTTATVNVYGVAKRLGEVLRFVPHRFLVLTVVLAALPLSQLGFSAVIAVAYPLIGYGALAFFTTWILCCARRGIR